MSSFDSLRLRTERLLLRPLGDADAAALLAIFSDPRAMRCAWASNGSTMLA